MQIILGTFAFYEVHKELKIPDELKALWNIHGLGLGSGFVHIDTRPGETVKWIYVAGKPVTVKKFDWEGLE
jgi:hypothetical protein